MKILSRYISLVGTLSTEEFSTNFEFKRQAQLRSHKSEPTTESYVAGYVHFALVQNDDVLINIKLTRCTHLLTHRIIIST